MKFFVITDHNDVLMEKKKRGLRLELSEAFGVVFVEQPNKNDLNLRENYWISLLNAQINIQKTYLPKIK